MNEGKDRKKSVMVNYVRLRTRLSRIGKKSSFHLQTKTDPETYSNERLQKVGTKTLMLDFTLYLLCQPHEALTM